MHRTIFEFHKDAYGFGCNDGSYTW